MEKMKTAVLKFFAALGAILLFCIAYIIKRDQDELREMKSKDAENNFKNKNEDSKNEITTKVFNSDLGDLVDSHNDELSSRKRINSQD